MCHGVDGSAWGFIVSGPGKIGTEEGKVAGKAIPYQLVDTGKYDVWMLNARGNYFSRDHLWLDPDS